MTQITQYPVFTAGTLPSAPSMNGMTVLVEAGDGTRSRRFSNGVEWTDDLTAAQVEATKALVSEYEIPADEFADAVTLTATGVVHGMPGRLSAVTVLSGTCDLALADGAGAGTSGIRTIATYAGLTAGELIPFPGDGLPFVNALLATITGTATLRFEVI